MTTKKKRHGPTMFTVFGFYRDNNQRAGFTAWGTTPEKAEASAIRQGVKMGGDFVPVVTLRGPVTAAGSKAEVG